MQLAEAHSLLRMLLSQVFPAFPFGQWAEKRNVLCLEMQFPHRRTDCCKCFTPLYMCWCVGLGRQVTSGCILCVFYVVAEDRRIYAQQGFPVMDIRFQYLDWICIRSWLRRLDINDNGLTGRRANSKETSAWSYVMPAIFSFAGLCIFLN